MGLAPYGEPKYANLIKDKLIHIKSDGSFKLSQDYFDYATGLKMTNEKFHKLFGQNPRDSKKEKLTQFHMDIASSIQNVTEEVMVSMAVSLKKEFNIKNLCLAGGVALNCVANGKILEKKIFENIWVQPAAGDAGGSLGAALALWHLELKKKRAEYKDDMQGSYLGPSYSDDEIEQELNNLNAKFQILNENEIIEKTSESLKNGDAVGWFKEEWSLVQEL